MGNENENLESKENQIANKLRDLEPVPRTLTVEITRLDIPTNGVVIVKDGGKSVAKAANPVVKAKDSRTSINILRKQPMKSNNNVPRKVCRIVSVSESVRNKQNEKLTVELNKTDETETKVGKTNEGEVKTMDKSLKEFKNDDQLITPSRVSNRLKNRKVKFDVLKLLSDQLEGDEDDDDVTAKRAKKILSKEQTAKPTSDETAQGDSNDEVKAKRTDLESKQKSQDEVKDNTCVEEKGIPSTEEEVEETDKLNDKSGVDDGKFQIESAKPAGENHNKKVSSKTSKNNQASTVYLEKGISLQLTEPPKKQVVNISLPPSNVKTDQNKKNSHVGLGPEILIRRISKINKKQTNEPAPTGSAEESPSSMSKEKPVFESSHENEPATQSPVPPKVSEKSKDEPTPQSKPSKPTESSTSTISPSVKKHKIEKMLAKTDSVDSAVVVIFKKTTPTQVTVTEARKRKQKRILFQNKRRDSTPEPDEIRDSPSPEPLSKRKGAEAPLAPPKQTPIAKKSVTPSKSKYYPNKEAEKEESYDPYLITDRFAVSSYEDDAFDKFFSTEDTICGHNDSLDSDSDKEDSDLLSHFIDLKKIKKSDVPDNNVPARTDENSTDYGTERKQSQPSALYELIQEVASGFQNWSIHALPNGSENLCLVQLGTSPEGFPVIKKLIQIDSKYKTKVFINQTLIKELEGEYDSYESIKQLVYTVDKM